MSEAIKERFEQRVALVNLQETTEGLLTVYYNGGQFKATRELIMWCERQVPPYSLDTRFIFDVVIDDNFQPIEIDDMEEFAEILLERYYEVINEYRDKVEGIRAIRKPSQA